MWNTGHPSRKTSPIKVMSRNLEDSPEATIKGTLKSSDPRVSINHSQKNLADEVPVREMIFLKVQWLRGKSLCLNMMAVIQTSFLMCFKTQLQEPLQSKSMLYNTPCRQRPCRDRFWSFHWCRNRTRNYRYWTNRVKANCQYHILVGMPWHVHANPTIDYSEREVHVGEVVLPIRPRSNTLI